MTRAKVSETILRVFDDEYKARGMSAHFCTNCNGLIQTGEMVTVTCIQYERRSSGNVKKWVKWHFAHQCC